MTKDLVTLQQALTLMGLCSTLVDHAQIRLWHRRRFASLGNNEFPLDIIGTKRALPAFIMTT